MSWRQKIIIIKKLNKNEEKKRKGRKSKGFVNPCIHAPSSHHTFNFYHQNKFWKVQKGK